MKTGIIIVALCTLSVFGRAQRITNISDTTNVIYAPNDYGLSIDSIVYKRTDLFSPLTVYFDKSNKIIAFKSIIKKDSCIYYDYWRDGQLKLKRVFLNTKVNGFQIEYGAAYCQNGNLICKDDFYIYKHVVTIYYCNGQKKQEYTILGPYSDGSERFWYENGNLKSQKYYKANSYGPVKIGEWKFYNETGGLDSTEVYQGGKLIKTITK